ncbi:Cullin-associated NEDD8-dissociated protein 1 [Nowakowskiella sp. JEL0407]|nr:Cullin-associated NEDD8-dissociated protein 1 [Nowakowskiella sp. JEL0407]
MATNDLMNELLKESFALDDSTERKVASAIVKLLEDKNAEVQNLAVKCLAPLVKKLRETQVSEIADHMCNLLTQKREDLRDIAGIGLKTLIIEIPSSSSNIVRRLIPNLFEQLTNKADEVTMDALEIITEILNRFGSLFTSGENGLATATSLQQILIPLLNHSRSAVRKRTTVALGSFVIYSSDELFAEMIKRILVEVELKVNEEDFEKLRTLIGGITTISRSSSARLGQYLNILVPLIIKYSEFEDDELREICLLALESFTLRCPTEVSPYLPSIIELALNLIKYDPNYDDGDDDDDEMDMDEEEEEEAEDEDNYSDDEDVSWKVRRASSKVLASIIGTRSDLLGDIYQTVASPLISRFKEREESVRLDIFNTFNIMVRQTGFTFGKGTNSQEQSLRNLIPKICKSLSKELNRKSIPTKQAGFKILRELVIILHGGLQNSISLFIPSIETSLSNAASAKSLTNTNLKIETLIFVRVLLMNHPAAAFAGNLKSIVNSVVAAAKDKFYKISSEALLATVELINVIRPITWNDATHQYGPIQPASAEAKTFIDQLYRVIYSRLQATDVDLEVKERSITALGRLIVQCGDSIPSTELTKTIYPLLLERLRNELTRITTVRVIRAIAASPLFDDPVKAETISFDSILPALLTELSGFLKKSHRQLRVISLQCFETLILFNGAKITEANYLSLLEDLKPLLLESDLHILPLVMSVLCAISERSSARVLKGVQEEIVPVVVGILIESPHLVSGGSGLQSLLKFWKSVISAGGDVVFDLAVEKLLAAIEGTGVVPMVVSGVVKSEKSTSKKQSFPIIAQSLAVLTLNTSDGKLTVTVNKLVADITSDSVSENLKYLALLTIGEIGRKIDLSGSHPTLHTSLIAIFSSPSEELKHASAYALGNIALGNLDKYMPVILSNIREGGQKRFLVLMSLREIISRYVVTGTRRVQRAGAEVSSTSYAKLSSFAPELWKLLIANVEQEDSSEESTRNIIAECLGKLSLTDPEKFLPDLKENLKSASPGTRMTVIMAIRFTFTDIENESFDGLLKSLIVNFLSLVKDADLNVRRVTLQTLNSAAHNKPELIRNSLKELLPLLYEETVVKEELIHIVEMGPFKHRVDDGLEGRKSAFECMYTLLETCLTEIEIFEFIRRVIVGLNDAAYEIKVLTHLMLQRLALTSATALAQRLEETVEPLKGALSTKPKANAVKQEIEKNNELIRSAARTVIILGKICDPVTAPKFAEMEKELKTTTAFGDMIVQVIQEVEQQSQTLSTRLTSTSKMQSLQVGGMNVNVSSHGLPGSVWPVRNGMSGVATAAVEMELS